VLGLQNGDRPPLDFSYWLYAGGVATVHLIGPRKPRDGVRGIEKKSEDLAASTISHSQPPMLRGYAGICSSRTSIPQKYRAAPRRHPFFPLRFRERRPGAEFLKDLKNPATAAKSRQGHDPAISRARSGQLFFNFA